MSRKREQVKQILRKLGHFFLLPACFVIMFVLNVSAGHDLHLLLIFSFQHSVLLIQCGVGKNVTHFTQYHILP